MSGYFRSMAFSARAGVIYSFLNLVLFFNPNLSIISMIVISVSSIFLISSATWDELGTNLGQVWDELGTFLLS